MNGLALCAGYGGIELALERVIPNFRTVCYVEGEAYAASHLIKKMEEGRLHPAPIWNDLRTFNGSSWRGKVDLIAGGFPCQPFSVAGKQLGDADPRHLWPFIVEIISEVRPRYLFFENVPGVVRWILSDILNDLTKLGYNASWCVVGASDVGAPHRRKRWFLLAEFCDPMRDGLSRSSKEHGEGVNQNGKVERDGSKNNGDVNSNTNDSSQCSDQGPILQSNRDNIGGLGSNDSNTNGGRSQTVQSSPSRRAWQFDPSRSCFFVSDTGGERCGEVRGVEPQIKEPGPKVIGSDGESQFSNTSGEGLEGAISEIKERESFGRTSRYGGRMEKDRWGGRFDEWWKVEPGMGRLVDGVADWVDKIRILGNGVVPQQAAYAFQILAGRLAAGSVENRTPKL